MLNACSGAAAEVVAARIEPLLRNPDWLGAAIAPMLAEMARDPMHDPPIRFQRGAECATVLLLDHPVATVTLGLRAPRDTAPGALMVASGRLWMLRVLRGGGGWIERRAISSAARISDAAGAIAAEPLRDGGLVRIDGRREATLLVPGAAPALTLTASIHADAAPLVRAWRRDDGTFERAASGDDRASRHEMLLRFLRAVDRRDAVPAFEAASRDGSYALRWAAVREWLALDAATAMPRLAAMAARDPHRAVRGAAARTLRAVAARSRDPACRR